MKNKPLEIGVTGGIGSGKSLVCHIFQIMNVPVYDADSRAKWLLANNLELRDQVIQTFGKESYLPNGDLNREYLSRQVFNHSPEVEKLNQIVHPMVALDYKNWVKENISSDYLIKEAALLFETGYYKQLDKVITIYAPVELRIQRVLSRDPGRTEAQIKTIISKQKTEEERKALADYTIINDGSELVIPQVLIVNKLFLNWAGK